MGITAAEVEVLQLEQFKAGVGLENYCTKIPVQTSSEQN